MCYMIHNDIYNGVLGVTMCYMIHNDIYKWHASCYNVAPMIRNDIYKW